MPRRLLRPEHADRLVAAVFGAYFLLAAPALFVVWHDANRGAVLGSPVLVDWLWPWVYALAGVLGIAYAARPESLRLAAFSGGAMILAVLSRAAALVVAWLTGSSKLTGGSVILAAATWTILGYALGTIWTRFLAPANRVRRGERT